MIRTGKKRIRVEQLERGERISKSRLFGSVVEHWIIDPAARIRFPPKSWDFFILICYALFFVTAFMTVVNGYKYHYKFSF